ncbi:hypothetical protein RFI_04509 [Reticulomyxa filosa]|uniref:Uncharacterized protein n=1 Tax=Reticulomyxa filosa TaxID=46433 RepID=X6P3A3_RETFI|nr:hypothetical protein RFI_04509 [Reticulomyxa filosa]|eukprot:ETO32608.1 hypothetical protein RFI_04509 [Reticulomyxa filosa]
MGRNIFKKVYKKIKKTQTRQNQIEHHSQVHERIPLEDDKSDLSVLQDTSVAIPLQNAHESENQEGISEEESHAHSPQKSKTDDQHSHPATIQIVTNTEIMQSPATLPTNVLPSNAATMNKSKLFVMLKKKREKGACDKKIADVCKLEASFEETKLSMDLFQQKLLDIKIAFEAKMNLLVTLEQDLKRTQQEFLSKNVEIEKELSEMTQLKSDLSTLLKEMASVKNSLNELKHQNSQLENELQKFETCGCCSWNSLKKRSKLYLDLT